jgi:hypothetical protein
MEMGFDAPAASLPGKEPPVPIGLMEPRVGLDAVTKRVFFFFREIEP